jgi:hypothetical protein
MDRRFAVPQSRSERYGEVKILDPIGTRSPSRSQSLYWLRFIYMKVQGSLLIFTTDDDLRNPFHNHGLGKWNGTVTVKSKSRYDWRSVGRSVGQYVEPTLGLVTRYYFLFESCCLVSVGPSLTRGRVCHLSFSVCINLSETLRTLTCNPSIFWKSVRKMINEAKWR